MVDIAVEQVNTNENRLLHEQMKGNRIFEEKKINGESSKPTIHINQVMVYNMLKDMP